MFVYYFSTVCSPASSLSEARSLIRQILKSDRNTKFLFRSSDKGFYIKRVNDLTGKVKFFLL